MLARLDTFTYLLVVPLVVFLFFIPKVNLINFAGESAGIRVDDLVLFCVFSIMLGGSILSRTKSCKIERLFFGMLFVFIASNLSNLIIFNQSNLFYSLRLLEYFVFFYIGYHFQERYSLSKLAWWILLINSAVMLLQFLGMIGGFSSEGFVLNASERVIGLTGGPWEIGALINFIFAILVLEKKQQLSGFQLALIFLSTFWLVLLTGARMPALAHLALLGLAIFHRTQSKSAFTLRFFFALSLFLTFLVVVPNPVATRSENLFSIENVNEFSNFYDSIHTETKFQGFSEIELVDGADLSWLMRASKWAYAIKQWHGNAGFVLLGVGPGTWGIALDGGLVRVITETGLLGIIVFLALFRRIAKLNLKMLGVVLAFSINMLMIDVHMAYKVMSFLFFSAGFFFAEQRLSFSASQSHCTHR